MATLLALGHRFPPSKRGPAESHWVAVSGWLTSTMWLW